MLTSELADSYEICPLAGVGEGWGARLHAPIVLVNLRTAAKLGDMQAFYVRAAARLASSCPDGVFFREERMGM